MTSSQYFLLRRLHSLLGIFPLGLFLFNHLLTNSTAIFGARVFEEKVRLIHMLGPALPLVEALFIFVPLSLHIVLGVYIATQARMEIKNMPYARNYAYVLQRVTGWIALVYIAYHVIHLRFFHDMQAEPFSLVLGRMFTEGIWGLPGLVWALIYLIGGLAVVFHFANGLCTFCMTWGITTGPRSQRAMAYAASAVGLLLTLMLISSIVGFMRIGPHVHDPGFKEEMQLIHAKH